MGMGGGASTQLAPAPGYGDAVEPRSPGEAVSCAPRQRDLGWWNAGRGTYCLLERTTHSARRTGAGAAALEHGARGRGHRKYRVQSADALLKLAPVGSSYVLVKAGRGMSVLYLRSGERALRYFDKGQRGIVIEAQ
jgi:hypothetical protein